MTDLQRAQEFHRAMFASRTLARSVFLTVREGGYRADYVNRCEERYANLVIVEDLAKQIVETLRKGLPS